MKEHKKKIDMILILILFFAIFLRLIWINSLVERDEGQFAFNTAVNYLPNHELYKQQVFEDNKFPVLYLFYSIPIILFGNSIIMIRLFNNLFFWISCYYFFKISFSLFKNKNKAYVSTLFYIIFMNIPYFEGQLVMSESVALHFTIFGYYALLRYTNKKQNYLLFLTLIFFLLSFLTRVTLIINLIILGIFWIKSKNININNKKVLKKTPWILAILVTLFILLRKQIYYYFKNYTLYLLNTVYVPISNWYILLLQFLGPIILIFVGFVELIKRTKIKHTSQFITAFILTFILGFLPNAYGHFFISVIPFFAILTTVGVYYLVSISNRYIKYTYLIIIFLFAIVNIYFWAYQHPNFNWDTFGWTWRYSDSDSKNMQESIAYDLRNLDGETLLLGWEPYVCFRANKPGCHAYFNFININRLPDWKNRFETVPNLIIYDIHEEDYKEYNLTIEYSEFQLHRKEGYSILVRK